MVRDLEPSVLCVQSIMEIFHDEILLKNLQKCFWNFRTFSTIIWALSLHICNDAKEVFLFFFWLGLKKYVPIFIFFFSFVSTWHGLKNNLLRKDPMILAIIIYSKFKYKNNNKKSLNNNTRGKRIEKKNENKLKTTLSSDSGFVMKISPFSEQWKIANSKLWNDYTNIKNGVRAKKDPNSNNCLPMTNPWRIHSNNENHNSKMCKHKNRKSFIIDFYNNCVKLISAVLEAHSKNGFSFQASG